MSVRAMTELEELRAEVASYREAFTAMEYARRIERFHQLDAIRDDKCPCCGSPIRVVDNGHGSGVKLEPRFAS